MNTRKSSGVSLPDIRSPEHEKQLGEWLGSRDETSHQSVGLDPGQDIWFDDHGERRAGKVLHEERDQHTGDVDVTIVANSETGSGTYVSTFKPNKERSMIQTKTKRTFD